MADQHRLEYEPPISRDRTNVVAIAAFILSLAGCPCLRGVMRTRPFWGGHPLDWVARAVDPISFHLLPLLAVLLGFVGCIIGWKRPIRGGGFRLSVAAILIAVAWELLMFLVDAFVPVIGPGN